jgi:hypothetical protein
MSSASAVTNDATDLAVAAKIKKYTAACKQYGWKFVPFAADTYAAFHPAARAVMSPVIDKLQCHLSLSDSVDCGTLVWRALSGAAISRAASQLARHSQIDRPAGLPLDVLNWLSRPRCPARLLHPDQQRSRATALAATGSSLGTNDLLTPGAASSPRALLFTTDESALDSGSVPVSASHDLVPLLSATSTLPPVAGLLPQATDASSLTPIYLHSNLSLSIPQG